MGAYLSEPMTAKESENGEGNKVKFGACSMQGWRVSQEDAHNCIPSFDENSSLFAVYDGHGGAEVAIYLSRHLPEVLKSCSAYKNGEFIKALEECYLKIDESIKTPEVLKEIQQLAKTTSDNEATVDYEEENVGALYEEATMPLDKLVAKYQSGSNDIALPEEDTDCKPGSSKSIAAGASPGSSKASAGGSSSCSSSSSSKAAGSSAAVVVNEKVNGESTTAADAPLSTEPASSSPCIVNEIKTESNGDNTAPIAASDDLIIEGKKIELLKPEKQDTKNCEGADIEHTETSVAPTGSLDAESTCKPDVNGCSTSISDSESKIESKSTTETALDKERTNASDDITTNGGSSSSDKNSGTEEVAVPASSETPRRKKVHPVPVVMPDSAPERRSPRKSQQMKNFDCSDSDSDEDDEDAGYNLGESDSDDDMEDEEEDLEEESSNEDDEDDEDELEDEEEEEDERFLNDIQEPGFDSGSTAVVCFMKWEADSLSMWVANAGDSRCVVCREGKAIDMSHDHKPELNEEAQRIVKAGGKVTEDGRVNGGLNLSRAIGDHTYKQNSTLPPEEQMISPLPSVQHIVLNPTKDKFVVLACDGVWNSMSSQEVVDFVNVRLDKKEPLSKICEELFDSCLSPDTCGDGTGCDNMTAVIVQLPDTNQAVSGSKRRFSSEEVTEDAESLKKSRVD